MHIDNVLILSAGFGLRLRPLTADTPKPHLRLGKQTILERLLFQLKTFLPTSQYFVNASYLPYIFVSRISEIPVSLRPSILWEPQLLGSANSVHNLAKTASGSALVLHGDLVLSEEYVVELESKLRKVKEATVFCHTRPLREARSRVHFNPSGLVESFVNKIHPDGDNQEVAVNSGIYFLPLLQDIGERPEIGVDICDSILTYFIESKSLFAEKIEAKRISVDSIEAYSQAQALTKDS